VKRRRGRPADERGADRQELGRLLEDVDVGACPQQRQDGDEAPDATADDRDPHRPGVSMQAFPVRKPRGATVTAVAS
jgi:hypothetical protein